jgi:hypothetical protein
MIGEASVRTLPTRVHRERVQLEVTFQEAFLRKI